MNFPKTSGIMFVLFFFLAVNTTAQMEISGFFDVIGINKLPTKETKQFYINQFELDVSYENRSHYSVGTAVAYNSNSGQMELAMAFIHYAFDDSRGKHPRREEVYEHSALQIGKFDMPFGLDYLSYASPDRPTISQPLVIEKTIAGWNDVGIDFHVFFEKLKFDVWAVNGFKEGISFGGNIRYKFFPFLEIGFSHSADIKDLKQINDWLSGIDLQILTDIIEIKSEFLWMKGVYEGKPDEVLNDEMHYGGYIQILTRSEKLISFPIFLTLRAGGWECDSTNKELNDSQKRYSATLGYDFDDNISIRTEIVANKLTGKNTTQGFIQLVISF